MAARTHNAYIKVYHLKQLNINVIYNIKQIQVLLAELTVQTLPAVSSICQVLGDGSVLVTEEQEFDPIH